MVPAWTLVLAFVVGLVVGVVGSRLAMGRAQPAQPAAPAARTEPELAAPEPAPDPAPEAADAEPEQGAEHEDPAAAVDDVVAELERRVKGRRTEGEADGTAGSPGRRG